MSAPHTESHRTAIEQLSRTFEQPLSVTQEDALASYLEQVASWNRKINLTAAREPSAMAEVMLADAFALARASLMPQAARVIDVGTGAGAPIVPLLLLRPDLSALCLEPLQKRATFLRMASVRLPLLGRMRVQQARLDPAQPISAEQFDVATSRATFAPDAWLRIGLLLAPRVIVMTAGGPPLPAPEGISLEGTLDYALPRSGAPRRTSCYRRG